MGFTNEEKEILSKYVSSADDNIFVINGLPGIVGAIFARYSRAKTGFRETFFKEFIKDNNLDSKKADELIERVLIAFGDDSVGELEGTHLALENISNLATKEIEDRRIGGSPIEQSTRYVQYDMKDEQGKFRFLREPNIMSSDFASDYEGTMNLVFERYSNIVSKLKEYFKKVKPIDEAEYAVKKDDKKKYKLNQLTDEIDITAFTITYNIDLKTKACDTSRVLLPAATLTNVGVFGNGRYLQNLLSHLFTLNSFEMNEIAEKGRTALNTVIPRYIARAKRNDYIYENEKNMQLLADSLFKNILIKSSDKVVLLNNPENNSDYNNFLLATMLYKYVSHPMEEIRYFVGAMPYEIKLKIFNTYIGDRKERRNRPGRALEFGYPLTFDIIGDFGIYRDLERHRMLTQDRQKLNVNLGFSIPDEISEIGMKDYVEEAAGKAVDLYNKLKGSFPYEAQYAVLFGFNMRWYMGMNPREAMHMLELRTGPQGHPNYRKVCQEMHSLISKEYPLIGNAMNFVDHNNYYWARGDSEAAQRRKESELEFKLKNQGL